MSSFFSAKYTKYDENINPKKGEKDGVSSWKYDEIIKSKKGEKREEGRDEFLSVHEDYLPGMGF